MAMLPDEDGCVLTCTAAECSYNKAFECFAPAIRVGDDHPMCDTFTTGRDVPLAQRDALVMGCAVAECAFNASEHCHARGITVDHHGRHADCVTFRP